MSTLILPKTAVPSAAIFGFFKKNLVMVIASLASLITFREYAGHRPDGIGRYLLLFSAFNFAFLGILLIAMSALG